MKPRRYDQLWNRWLLIDSGVTFEEWLDSLREYREQVKQQAKLSRARTDEIFGLAKQMAQQQQLNMRGMASLGGLLGAGIQSIGQIGMSLKRSY